MATYEPREPSSTVFYKVIADHLETFLASFEADLDAKGLPAYVQREFYDSLQCGILAHGFLRLGCDMCYKERLLPFSCKRRGFCPSWADRRMAQTTAHLVERVIPHRAGPYDHPYHDWAVLREPSGHTRYRADAPVFKFLGLAHHPAGIVGAGMLQNNSFALDFENRTFYVAPPG